VFVYNPKILPKTVKELLAAAETPELSGPTFPVWTSSANAAEIGKIKIKRNAKNRYFFIVLFLHSRNIFVKF
jgi:hypothetical protein